MSNGENNLASAKVQTEHRERKATWPTASCRVSPDELHLIDAAAYKARKKRAELVYEGTMRRVREILNPAT